MVDLSMQLVTNVQAAWGSRSLACTRWDQAECLDAMHGSGSNMDHLVWMIWPPPVSVVDMLVNLLLFHL